VAGNSALTVSVGADITDLQTKVAQAKVEFQAASAAMMKVARDARAASDDMKGSFGPELQRTAGQAAQATVEYNKVASALKDKLKPAIKETREAMGGLQGVIGQNRVAFNELTHTTRAVADGFASGINPMTLFTEEFFRVAQAITEFNTISISTIAKFGAIGAAAVAAAGAVYLYANRLAEIRDAKDTSASFQARGVDLKPDVAEGYMRSLKEAGWTVKAFADVNDDSVRKILDEFQKIPQATPQLMDALVHALPDMAQMMHQGPEEAAKGISAALTDLKGRGSEYVESLTHSADATNAFNESLAKSPLLGQTVLLNTLSQKLREYATNSNAARNTNPGLMASILEGPTDGSLTDLSMQAEGIPHKSREDQAEDRSSSTTMKFALANAAANEKNFIPDESAINAALERIAQDTSRTKAQVLADQVAYLKKEIDTTEGSYTAKQAIVKLYESKEVDLRRQTGAEELEVIRTNASTAAAAAGASRAAEVAAQKAVLNAGLQDEKLTADDKLELRKQLAQLDVREVRADAANQKKTQEEMWQDYSATMRNAITDARGNYAQELKIAEAWVAEGKRLFGQHVHNYEDAISAMAALTKKQEEDLKKAAENQANIERNLAEASANLGKIGAKSDVGEFKPNIGLVFDDSAMEGKVSSEIAKLKAALDTQLAGLQQSINGKLKLGDTVGASADYKTMTADVEEFANKAQELNEKAAAAVEASWSKITTPIGNAFDKIFDDALTGHQRIGIAAERAALGMVEDWAKASLRIVATEAAKQLQLTFMTRAGAIARGQSTAQEELTTLKSILAAVSQTTAGQAAQTGATAAGTATRVAITQAGAAAGHAAEAAAGAKTVMGDAAKAASGTYSSVAQIPYVGWILAPAAAAVAFAAVAGFEGLASAEGGWDNVPTDGALTELHKNEMVMPAHLANGIRNMVANGQAMPASAGRPNLGAAAANVTNNGGNSSKFEVNHTQNFNGVNGASAGQIAQSTRSGNRQLHETLKSWHANGATKLPGR
jgi:hypothetical protein